MSTDCSLFMKIVSSDHLLNMLLFLFCFDIQSNFGTQHVLQMLQASEKDLPVLWSQMIAKLFGGGVIKWLMKTRNYLSPNIYWSIHATLFWIPPLKFKFWTDSITKFTLRLLSKNFPTIIVAFRSTVAQIDYFLLQKLFEAFGLFRANSM